MPSLRRAIISFLPRSWRNALRGREGVIRANLQWRIRHLLGQRAPMPRTDGKVRIHLGCGPVDQPGFINVDAIGFPHVHHLAPVYPLPMFADNTVDLVYVSHCLEHIEIAEVPRALQEWTRIIKPGGILRIAVPDFEAVLQVYEASGRSISSIQYVLMGGQDYPFNFHMAVFDRLHLTELMQKAGLTNIAPWQPSQDQWCIIKDCSSASCRVNDTIFPVSLNLQGTKAHST